MRRLLLVAVLLLAILAAGLAWLLLARPSSSAGVASASAASATATSDEHEPDARGAERDAGGVDGAARPAPGTEREELVAAAADAVERPVAIEGALDLPSETPLDERLEVLAFAGGGDPLARVRDAADPAGVSGFLARAPVAADGTYRIDARGAAGAVWLVPRGRYLFATAAARVDLGEPSGGTSRTLRAPPLVLEVGAWVSGRIVAPADVRPDESDLSEVRASLGIDALRSARGLGAGTDAAPERTPAVAADGTFEVLGMRPETGYRLGALSERFAARKGEPFDLAPGEHRRIELALSRGAHVAGRVVGPRGYAVAGADVEARLDPVVMGQGAQRVRAVETDEDGAFALDAVPTGELQLEVSADGFLPLVRELDLRDGERLDDLVLELDPGRGVSGFVRWPDGAPAPGARVTLEFDMNQMASFSAFNAMSGASGEATAGEDGSFAIAGLGGGPFTVRATSVRPETVAAEDGAGAAQEPFPSTARVDGVRPDTRDLELVLERPIGFDGVVRDELGEPVTAFTIHVRTAAQGTGALGADRHQRAFESEDGTFFFDGLRAGEWQVVAAAPGFGSPAIADVTLPVPDGATPLAVALARVARVSGVVVGPDGEPVAGAEVGRERSLQRAARATPGETERERARSDDRGRFTLEGLTPGTLSLVASARDLADSAPVVVELAPSGTVDGVVVTLREGGLLVGEIYAPDGEPEAGREILAQRTADFGVQRWTRSDGEGRFTIEHMVPGSWQVMAMPTRRGLEERRDEGDDFTSVFAEMRLTMADIVDGEETFVQLGAPPADPVRVHGRVLLDGEGLEGVLMSFVPDGLDRKGLATTTSKAGGAYALDLPSTGPFLVTLQKLGAGNSQQNLVLYETVPDVEEHELDLAVPVGAVSGRVTGPDGAPLADARVTLFTGGGPQSGAVLGGNYGEVRTDAEGRYRISWLQPGRFTVGAGGAALGGMWGDGSRHGRVVRQGIAVGEGEDVRVDFELATSGGIEGQVRDAAGAPVAGAVVFVQGEDGGVLEPFSTIASDAAGRFRYEGLAPGRYLVSARGSSHASGEAVSVDVGSDETARVTLAVEEGALLVVTTSDEEGAPLPAALSVVDERGREVGQLKSLGELMELFSRGGFSTTEQRVGPLAPGSYRVTASAGDGREATKPVTLRAGQDERKLNLRLR